MQRYIGRDLSSLLHWRYIGWFVEAGSSVCEALYYNLESLTGLDWREENPGFKRTGSALHRFRSSRVSAGGFISISHSAVTPSMVTSDTMTLLTGVNHDFMFQPGMLYSQLQSLEINTAGEVCNFSHHHLSCPGCIRRVPEIWLTTDMSVDFGSHTITVQNMLGRVPKFIEFEPMITLQSAIWDLLTSTQQSYHLGVAQGMLIGTSALEGLSTSQDTPLFPYVIHRKVIEMATALVIFTSNAFLAQGNVERIVADAPRFLRSIWQQKTYKLGYPFCSVDVVEVFFMDRWDRQEVANLLSVRAV